MKISNTKSCGYWKNLRRKILEDYNNNSLWLEAHHLFLDRLDSRYFEPANIIKKYGNNTGEGFAIVTIYCALIEFLETTYLGLNYKEGPLRHLKDYEYNSAKCGHLFQSFLVNRKPFLLDEELAISFYKNVRCGLIHEAQTKNGWLIRVDNPEFITTIEKGFVLNRDIFRKKIDQYLILYKKHLFTENELKEAFIRKFDGLCN
jgi:hypothetical protein